MSGVPQFLRGQLLQTPPLPTTDLSGRTMIVTGANTGLGLDCAKHLVRLNVSRLILACRNVSKGEKAREEILASQTPAASSSKRTTTIEVWPIDLTSYASVVAFSSRCTANLDRLDSAILNAGVSMKEYTRAEDDETTITVNVISTFLLAVLLLPKLRESATKYNIVPHIAIVGSAVHFWVSDLTELTGPASSTTTAGSILPSLSDPQKAIMSQRYFLSKLLVIQCVRQLASLISSSKKPFVVINNVAPGWCRTELFRHDDGGAGGRIALKLIGRSSEEGSRTLVHGAIAGKESHGQYLSECQVKPVSGFVRSKEGEGVQKAVWEEVVGKMERVKPGVAGLI